MLYRLTFAVALAIAIFSLVLVAGRPLLIAYHQYALEKIHEQIYASPSVISDGFIGCGNGELFDRQQWHCNRLVALGHYFHKKYRMENLPDTGEIHGAFWRLVQEEFPDRRYPTLSYPDNELEVWELAEFEPEWDAFAAKYNIKNFAERFMASAIDDAGSEQQAAE